MMPTVSFPTTVMMVLFMSNVFCCSKVLTVGKDMKMYRIAKMEILCKNEFWQFVSSCLLSENCYICGFLCARIYMRSHTQTDDHEKIIAFFL